MLLNNEWVKKKIKEEIKRYLETNENEDSTTQNLWDTGKAILTGTLIALRAYLKKQEKAQLNNVTSHLKEFEKEQTKPKVSRRKVIIKIRGEINEIESKKLIKINETKSWFFERINNIDKLLTRLVEKKEKRPK